MWVKILLLILSIVLITVSFPRSLSAWLDASYRWQPEPDKIERIQQLETINAFGMNVERGYELGDAYFKQAVEAENATDRKQAYDKAFKVFTDLLAYDPHHKEALQSIAFMYLNQYQCIEAQPYLAKLLAMMTKRDFGAQARLSYYDLCFKWSFTYNANKQPEQEKFLLQRAKDIFISSEPFLYWRWNSVRQEQQFSLNYIDDRLEKLAEFSEQAPVEFIEIAF